MKNNGRRIVLRSLVVIVFLGLETVNFWRIDSGSHSVSDTLRPFIIQTVFLGTLFVVIFILVNLLSEMK